MKKTKTIGLALGAGGARGFAHIGVLKVLEKNNIKLDYVCGVSMGALIGACYVLGIELKRMEKIAIEMRKRDMVKFLDLSRRKSLIKGNKIIAFIKDLINDADFAQTKIPFAAIATNLGTGEEKIINKGLIAEAVQASISVPGIFPPIKINNEYFIDGGVVNPTPVDVCKNYGVDVIIGVDLVMQEKVKFDNPGIITTLMQSYEIIRNQAIKHKLKEANKQTILIKPDLGGIIDSFKFNEIPKMIKAGETATEKFLPEILRKIKG